jgi:hypothetical protein
MQFTDKTFEILDVLLFLFAYGTFKKPHAVNSSKNSSSGFGFLIRSKSLLTAFQKASVSDGGAGS